MKTLIKNGTIVTSAKQFKSDILAQNGKIVQISNNIPESQAEKVIQAEGLYVFPGGIDPHVHMYLPTPAGYTSDDFESGSRAGLFGGTTTLLDFVTPSKGQSITDALKQRKEEAKNSLVDYSFHVSPVEWRDTTEQEIKECIKDGITSFKVYMAYKGTVGLNDTDFFKVLQTVGRFGGMVTVHCELGDEVDEQRNRFVSENHVEPLYHCLSRPAEFEAEAVKRAIEMAKQAKCPLYIVHVSAKESLKYIKEAQSNGQKVFAETCPHYLLLDDSRYHGDFKQTAPYTISPPLRKKADSDALWNAIKDGTVKTIGTDHCPFNLSQKALGINDFRLIPNGAGGIEHRLALLYTYGVLENRITLNQMVDLFSTQPAKIFGLYPKKGEIAVGADADITIWNSSPENTISAKTHHQICDVNMFEGYKIKGISEYVIAGGQVIIENGDLVDSKTRGKYLKR
jgi:dihydropyrimidinase